MRDREVGVNRIESFDHQQCVVLGIIAAAGIDDVADVDETLTGAAVDWRMNEAVAEFYFCGFDRGVVDFDRFVGAAYDGARGFGVCSERVVVGA